jgi:hypothetical protein
MGNYELIVRQGNRLAHYWRDKPSAIWSCGKEEVVTNIASEVTTYFNQQAMRALLGWLLDIEESARWNPRRYWHLVKPEY